MRRAGAPQAILFGLLALLVVPVFPHFVSPNEMARWMTAASLVDRRSPEVTPLAGLLGPRFEDLSEKDGRLYSNKAPGLALAALPGYALVRAALGPPSAGQIRAAMTGMRLVAATVPALLLALVVAGCATAFGVGPGRTALVVGALLLATPLLAYGLLLYAHALVAACLFGAWALLFLEKPGRNVRREVLAGALLGLAVLSDYPAVFPASALVFAAATRRDGWRVIRVALGGLPFALLLGSWNAVSFGSPLALSSGLERDPAFRELARQGLFGIALPSPATFVRLLLDPEKGLLLFSPFVLLSPAAFVAARRRLPRGAFLGLLLPPLAILLTYAGYPNWHGGWTVGPRYLVSALPFLVFPFVFVGGGRTEAALLGSSAGACATAALAFPFVPEGFPLPWASFSVPLLAEGLGAPSVLHLVGVRGLAASSLLLVVVAAGLALALPSGLRLFAATGALAWVVVPWAWFALWPLPPPVALRRGYVEEVYFGKEGAIAASLPSGVRPPARLLARRDLELTLPPSPWRF